mgnify:CR=1 FL=1
MGVLGRSTPAVSGIQNLLDRSAKHFICMATASVEGVPGAYLPVGLPQSSSFFLAAVLDGHAWNVIGKDVQVHTHPLHEWARLLGVVVALFLPIAVSFLLIQLAFLGGQKIVVIFQWLKVYGSGAFMVAEQRTSFPSYY